MELGDVAVDEAVEDPPHVRQSELAVIGLVERADPGVEELDGLCASFDLRRQVIGHHLGSSPASRCQAAGCSYMSAFVRAKLVEWPPSIA